MSRRYEVDDLIVETNSAADILRLAHPAVPGGPVMMHLQKARVFTDPATRNVCLELGHNGREIVLAVERLSAPSVLVAVRNALVDLRKARAATVVQRFHDELMTQTRREQRVTVEGVSSKTRILTSDIEALMEAVDMARSEIVPCLMGFSGIGKTEGIESFARRHGRQVVHLIASQVLPTEVSGMTMPNQETHSMDVFDHSRISHMRDGDILFLDELLKGQQQVLSACLTMVQERRLMSGTPLPDVIIVAAANPLASPKMLPVEIRQRFLFVDVTFDGDSWCDYMRKRGVPRPELVVSGLVTDREDDDWNTLTPRTATKLLLWLRDTRDTDARATVETTIRNMFDGTVLNRLTSCLNERYVKPSGSPMDQAVGKLHELMADLPETDSTYETILREKTSEILDDEDFGKDPNKVSELLSLIERMSGGNEILDALRNETVSLGEF